MSNALRIYPIRNRRVGGGVVDIEKEVRKMEHNQKDFPENTTSLYSPEDKKTVAMAYKAACSDGFALRLVSVGEAKFNIWRYWKLSKKISKKSALKKFYALDSLLAGEILDAEDYKFVKLEEN